MGGREGVGDAACLVDRVGVGDVDVGAVAVNGVGEVRQQVAHEVRDDSLEALDKIWEEEAVDFMQAEQQERCPSQSMLPGKAKEETAVPLHWVDFKHEGQAQPAAQEVRNV